MAGLDDTTCDGIKGFALLHQCVNTVTLSTEVQKQISNHLDMGKRYLKTSYALHCLTNSTVASHCISCALFNSGDESFQPSICTTHIDKCKECTNLATCLNKIETIINELPNSEEKDELLYDVNSSIESIYTWIKHILRSVQQNKAREHAMNNLDLETGLWLSDWAQKILPVAFREGQKEYFGKKGMSMHIDCFILQNGKWRTAKACLPHHTAPMRPRCFRYIMCCRTCIERDKRRRSNIEKTL